MSEAGPLPRADALLLAAAAGLAAGAALGLACARAFAVSEVRTIAAAPGAPPLEVTLLEQHGSPKDGHVGIRHTRLREEDMAKRSAALLLLLNQRRSLRFYSTEDVPDEVVRDCVLAAGTAPSGAHCQPWHFCLVRSAETKRAIRELVEHEEQLNYDRRMRRSWVKDVEGLVTQLHEGDKVAKPYLADAPVLCVVMKQTHGVDEQGARVDHYYVEQSVGLAVGLFLAALTNVGLVTLTSTPMGAEKGIRELLGRPASEKVFLLMPIGYPANDATVPFREGAALRKPLESIASFH